MSSSQGILIVSHNARNEALLREFLERAGYNVVGVRSLQELDQVLARDINCDLALFDVGGFDRRIWQRCDSLRERGTPFLVVSSSLDCNAREEGLRRGSRGLLTKPVVKRELISLIDSLLS